MSKPLPPDLQCPKCGEMRNLESDGHFHWLCNVCSKRFPKRPFTVMDRRFLKSIRVSPEE
jgi:tRNA(Ile2) C34 agmatinyltransferase TiaS